MIRGRVNDETLWLAVVAASGAAALIYQVVWQRWLALIVGGTATSAAVVVAAFLAGLGLGAIVGGHLADRVTTRRGFLVFALLECGIALCGLASASVLDSWLSTAVLLSPERPILTFVVLFAALMPATVLMGMTMPVLATAVRQSTPLAQAGLIGRLVGVNTVGAAIGAVASILLVVPMVGYDGAVHVAVVLNLVCAAVSLARWKQGRGLEHAGLFRAAPWARLHAGWIVHACVAGTAGIAYELVAYRMLDYIIKGRAQTFALLLGAYLVGFGAGSWLGNRVRRRVASARLHTFFATQVLLYVSMAALPLIVIVTISAVPEWFASLWKHGPSHTPDVLALNYAVLPVILLSLPALLMGLGFSLSQQLIQTDDMGVGRRLGWLTGANAIGCVLGATATTYWWLPEFGTANTVRGLALVGLAYAVVWGWRTSARLPAVIGIVAVCVAAWAVPEPQVFWSTLSGSHDAARVLVREERNGVANLRFAPDGQAAQMFAGGEGQSLLPRSRDGDHILIGAIPVFMHDNPARVGIVGLGSGGTLWGAASRSSITSLVCWELLGSQRALLRDYVARTGAVGVTFFDDDPRVSIVVADGRHALARSTDLFDVFTVDALQPEAAGAGRLYSQEFFTLLRARLAPGGLAATWAPTERTVRTLRAVFPHVVQIGTLLAVASNEPVSATWEDVQSRFADPAVARYFGPLHGELVDLMRTLLTEDLSVVPASDGHDVNTDMRPLDELGAIGTLVDRFWRRQH